VKVYFSDPQSPWQRGIDENSNLLLRQYLPKGIDLSGFTQKELDAIVSQLITRPRKSMGYRCPAQVPPMPSNSSLITPHFLHLEPPSIKPIKENFMFVRSKIAYSNRIVGYSIDSRMKTSLAVHAVRHRSR